MDKQNLPAFVTFVAQDRAVDARNILNTELSERVLDALTTRKQELASSLFGGGLQEEVEQVEESEQIDELKSSTLGSYIKKAAQNRESQGYRQGENNALSRSVHIARKAGHEVKDQSHYQAKSYNAEKKAMRRADGIRRAVDKLTKRAPDNIKHKDID